MKKVFKTMAFTLLGLVLSMNLWGTEATLNSVSTKLVADATTTSVSMTFNGVTCTVSRDGGANNPGFYTSSGIVRYYSKDVMTLSVPTGNVITKIVFEMTSGTVGTASPTGLSSDSKTWTGSANSVSFTGGGTVKITSITVTYSAASTDPVVPSITMQPEGATYEKDATATALIVAASGNPTPSYQWYSNTTNSTSGASAISGATNASYTPSTAAIGTKYYYCVATNTQGSATSDIVAVTVTAALPKITITADQVTDFTNSYKEYTWTASDVSGKLFAYKQNGMQFNTNKDGYYVYNTDPIPGNIRSIKMTTHNSGTEREWNVWVSEEPITDEDGVEVQLDKKNVAKAGTTWEVSGSYQYFYLEDNSGSSNISEIVITYEELVPTSSAVTFAAPEGGSLVIKNGATTLNNGDEIQDGTVLDVEFGMTPAEAYKDVAIKVTNTTTSADVTSTVYNSETQKITMPRYPITVAVTFTKLYKIEAATVTGGTISWEDANKAKPTYVEAGTYIQALQEEATHYEFKSFDIYKTGETTTKVEDADGLFEMPAYDVTISGTFDEMQCTALPSAPVLGTPSISYADGVTLNWNKLDAASGYVINVWKGTDKIVEDEVIDDVNTLSSKITETMDVNTEYSYSIAGLGDGETYCMLGNPANESTFTTADYPAAALTLSENGVERAWGTGLKLNSKINLPTDAATEITGKVLVGYVAENFEDTKSAEPDNMLPLGAEYTMTATEAKLFAVYATKSEGDAYYQKITAAETDWSGKYLIVSTDGAMDGSLNGGTGGVGKAQTHKTVTENDKVGENIKASFGDQYYMIIEKTGNNYYLKSQYTGEGATPYIYRTSNSNGMDASATASTAIGISWDDGIKIAGATSGNGASTLLKYNKTSGSTGEMFRFYKDGGTSQQAITLYKRVANIDYSAYVTKGTKALGKPSFDPEGGEYNTPQTITLSATEGDIYYTINDGEEKLYEEEIKLENRGQYVISAYAKKGDAQSEPNEQTYTLDWAYTLAELVAEGAPTTTGRTVTVILTDEVIESIVTSGSYVNGFFTMVGDKKIEVYCKNSPSDWEAGGKVSGTVTCPWKDFQGTWELCPTNWDWASYTAPAKITSLVITGDVDNKNYTAGQKLDFTGLTVTGVYSDATEEDVTEDVVWTEVTLTENQPEATATATLNNAKTGNLPVVQSKTITGLTVGAKVELSKIEITTEASKKDFFVGRNFNHEGIVVTATYSNGSTSNVTNACDFSTPTLENKGQETVTITYSEGEGQDKKEVTTSYTINVKYMNLNDLVAEDIATNTSVKVAFSDVEITGFYKNSSDKRAGVYVNVIGKNGSNIELYSSGTPSATLNDWQEGGKLASKGNYISGTWKYYDGNDVWEIDFGSAYAWATNIEYTAPEIYPTEISMSIPTATVKQSKSLELEANFIPANATVLNNLEWSSDNNQVTVVPSQDKKSAKVTVAPDATVGTATITVKVDDKDGNELSATCVITIQEYSVPRYGLYNGAISGGDYIFKADGKYYFMNNTNNNGRLANVANENNPEIVNNIITTDAETYVWQIAKSGDYWTIKNLATQTYVVSTGSGNASLSDSPSNNTEKWTITYDETNEVYTFANLGRSESTSEPTKCYLRNNNTSGWACYASGTGNAITLYKAGFTPAAALQSIEIKGDLEITEYFQGKSVKYDGLTVEGTYSDGDKKTITEGIVWSANPAKFTETGDNISVTITATVQTKNGEITDDANFTVKVVESQKVNYGLVTNVNTLYDGATIILGAVFGTATDPIYAVNQGFDTKYLAAYRSNTEGSDLEYADEVMKTAYASEITLKKVEEGWKLLGEDGKYINGAGDLSQTTDVAEATVWTISIEDGVTKIANDNNVICYNTSAPRFKTYTGTSQTVINCGIYMKNLLPVRTGLTIGQYTTYCEPYAVVAGSYSGATFWNIADKTYMSDGVRLASITIEQHTGNLEAGVPYIMLPEDAQLTGVQYGEAVDAPAAEDAHNGLVGVFEKTMFGSVESDEEAIERGIYIISDGTLYLCGNNCGVYGNRAYIQRDQINPMPLSGAPRRVIGNPNGTPTNLNGLNGNVKAQKALIDGHIYIIRENKMYNAQGLFVK